MELSRRSLLLAAPPLLLSRGVSAKGVYLAKKSGGGPPRRLGMNTGGNTYFDPGQKFADLMKSSATWAVTGGSGNVADAQLNAQGLPTTMALANGGGTATRFQTVMVYGIPPFPGQVGGPFHSGNYVLLYDGDMDVALDTDASFVGNGGTGRDIYNVPFGASSYVGCHITAVRTPATQVSIVYSPDSTTSHVGVNEAAFLGGARFSPDYLTRFGAFKCVRFMAAQSTLGSGTVNFSDRMPDTYFSYTHDPGDGLPVGPTSHIGVSLEACVDLCNVTGADLWINVPFLYSDAAMASMAALVLGRLNSARTCYVEYGNEAWNPGAILASVWTEMNTLGAAAYPGDPVNGFSPAFDYSIRRTAQNAVLWQSVWTGGDRARLVCVAGGQHGFTARNQYILDATAVGGSPDGTGGGDPSGFTGKVADHIDALATAPYFGSDMTVPDSTTLDQLFQEINSGGVVSGNYPGGMIAESMHYFGLDQALAASYGKRFISYENGQGLVPGGSAALRTLFDAAQRDARMGTAYTAYYNGLFAINGGDLLSVFTDVQTFGNFGDWGVLENVLQTSSPRYDALKALL